MQPTVENKIVVLLSDLSAKKEYRKDPNNRPKFAKDTINPVFAGSH